MARITFIEYLIEERQQQTYGYHATNKQYLKSILKKGLKPNYNDGGYGSNETSSYGIPLSPLPGIYFTTNGRKAEHIGKSNYKHPLIIIAKVSPNSRTIDEDNFNKIFGIKKIYSQLQRGKSPENVTHELLNSDEAVATFSRLHPQAYKSIKKYILNYISTVADYYRIGDSADYTSEKGDAAAKVLKNAEFALTKALSYYSKTDTEMQKTNQDTFKIDGEVGFSGRNRIVGLYDPQNSVGWGDIADFKGIAYHIYDNPTQLLDKQ